MKSLRAFVAALFLVASGQHDAVAQLAQVPLPGKNIPKYVEPLPQFTELGGRVKAVAEGNQLQVRMQEIQQKVLPAAYYTALGAPFNAGTYVWAYKFENYVTGNQIQPANYPAFTIEATKGIPLKVKYINNLTKPDLTPPVLQSYLVVDQTLHWADPLNQGGQLTPYAGPVPAVVHLHGGEVPSAYDGGPDAWFTPGPVGTRKEGPGFVTDEYVYPNSQEAATIWFHDHALGATRLNVYAGLAGFYFVRDPVGGFDDGSGAATKLPGGKYEVELAIQDKMFDVNGQLLFPNLGINPVQHPFWLPEFFGDAIVVNGKTWPFMNVEPRRYRFRIVNGSNARFYTLMLSDNGRNGPTIWQIGSDGGLLNSPVPITPPQRLLLAPGERADIIIDFALFANKTLLLVNDAKAPYPNGAPADPQTVGQIMQFRVVTPLAATDNSLNPTAATVLRTPIVDLKLPTVLVDKTRQLTLNEVMGMGGPLEILVNNSKWDGRLSIKAANPDDPSGFRSEMVREGEIEEWKIINLTADAHPIHLHLVQYQLVSRQAFQTNKYLKAYGAAFPGGVSPVDGLTYPAGVYIPGYGPPTAYTTTAVLGGNPDITPFLQGAPRPPQPNENGWKDTFVMYPGEVTTVRVKFAPQEKAGDPKGTSFFSFDPSAGPGYVWHCHIVDHEDNEMMRPYGVLTNPNAPSGRPGPGFPVGHIYPPVMMQGALAKSGTPSPASVRLPAAFSLDQNYPNPFNPSTEIRFALPSDARVKLTVYNTVGQQVGVLVDGDLQAGWHAVKFDAKRLASGLYVYRLDAGTFTATRSMLLVK